MVQPAEDGGGSDSIVYPLDHISEVAAKMLTHADLVQQQYNTMAKDLSHYISNTFAPEMHDTAISLVQPYLDRLHTSYQWQIDLANALYSVYDLMSSAENDVSNRFKTKNGTIQ